MQVDLPNALENRPSIFATLAEVLDDSSQVATSSAAAETEIKRRRRWQSAQQIGEQADAYLQGVTQQIVDLANVNKKFTEQTAEAFHNASVQQAALLESSVNVANSLAAARSTSAANMADLVKSVVVTTKGKGLPAETFKKVSAAAQTLQDRTQKALCLQAKHKQLSTDSKTLADGGWPNGIPKFKINKDIPEQEAKLPVECLKWTIELPANASVGDLRKKAYEVMKIIDTNCDAIMVAEQIKRLQLLLHERPLLKRSRHWAKHRKQA